MELISKWLLNSQRVGLKNPVKLQVTLSRIQK
jgi:hypothetical protein